jgi:hypothetical protein
MGANAPSLGDTRNADVDAADRADDDEDDEEEDEVAEENGVFGSIGNGERKAAAPPLPLVDIAGEDADDVVEEDEEEEDDDEPIVALLLKSRGRGVTSALPSPRPPSMAHQAARASPAPPTAALVLVSQWSARNKPAPAPAAALAPEPAAWRARNESSVRSAAAAAGDH